MSVNRERVGLLVTALRSKEYKQGVGRLCTVEASRKKWCCLGVATDVAEKNGVKLRHRVINHPGEPCRIAFDDEMFVLPEKVRKWYGFDSSNPLLKVKSRLEHYSATACNDGGHDEITGKGMTFEQIADLFETRYLK
jgi:hypothetical protein